MSWRENIAEAAIYQVPYVDRIDDTGGTPLQYLPRPRILDIEPGRLEWTPVPGAVSYGIQIRSHGTLYQPLAIVSSTVFEGPQVYEGPLYRVVAIGAANQKSLPSEPAGIPLG